MLAVQYPPKPLLILAGAGTGKTTTIVGRMANLIQKQNAVPESILALTFTNDAADHLQRKLKEKIGKSGESIHACTFHSFAQAQTNIYFKEIGYSEPPTIMNKFLPYYFFHHVYLSSMPLFFLFHYFFKLKHSIIQISCMHLH